MPNTIAQNLQRLVDDRNNIVEAIEYKGGIIESTAGLDDCADAIMTIGEPSEYPDLSQTYGVCHRGFCQQNTTVSENTIEAFKMAKAMGFNWIETDIQHTSDHVPILNHDPTIAVNEESSAVTIANVTWSTLSSYTLNLTSNKITSFEEGLDFCRNNDLGMYIELKGGTQAEIEADYELVRKHGMEKRVVWISFYPVLLNYIKDINPSVPLQLLVSSSELSGSIDRAKALMTGKNQVGYDIRYTLLTQTIINNVNEAGLTLAVWTVDNPWEVIRLHKLGAKQFTSNMVNASNTIKSYRSLTNTDFIQGALAYGSPHYINTASTNRISFVGYNDGQTPYLIETGKSYEMKVTLSSSAIGTLRLGVQIFGGQIYKKLKTNQTVTSGDSNYKHDFGW